jgi:hypothetical protein
VLGIQGTQNISPKLAIPRSSCIHPSTHNQETFGNRLPQPSKNIRYTSYGNTPELPPQYWVASRWSHQQLHKRDFDVGETQVFQNCNDKIVTTTPRSSTPRDTATTPKCQEAPRTMFLSQNHRNDSKIPRDPKFFLVKFEKRRVKTLRQDASPEKWRDWGVKRIPNSPIYNS